MIQVELDSEKNKQNLSLKSDFNMSDAFRLFDKYNNGFLYKVDLEEGLNKLAVYPTRTELNLLFRRYDSNGDGKLRYSEFTEMFMPKDRTYAEHLNNKRANYGARSAEESFTISTRLDMADFLRQSLRNEG
jgi:hypothetical protein